jgi:4-hydroxybenzoyl-CoA reductase subunit beta
MMSRLPYIEYLRAGSIDESLTLLKEHSGNITILAGGTDLLPSMKQGLVTSDYVLDVKRITELEGIDNDSQNGLRIGALTKLTWIEESPEVKKTFTALAEAAGSVAATQIKNMGTLGGNIVLGNRCWYYNQSRSWRKAIERCLKTGGNVCHVVRSGKRCHAYLASDTVPSLVALDARIKIRGSGGERECLLKDFYTRDGRTPNILKKNDMITHILLPPARKNCGSSYKKLRLREAIDFPLAGAAASVVLDEDRISAVKIVLGAVGSGPIEVTEAAGLLKGALITEDLIDEAGRKAQQVAQPVQNTKLTPGYRRKMAGILAKHALREAIKRAKHQSGEMKG